MKILHSNIRGDGDDLIILHGFLGMGDNWRTPGKRLAQAGYRVHLLDQRNHGRSFWSDEFSYEVMARDLLHYMDHHQIAKATLLGHSMGGKTAMTLAVQHPERCVKLIVIDIAPKYYPPHHQDIVEALTSLDLTQIKSRTEADTVLAQSIKEQGIRQWLLKNLYWETPEILNFRCNLEVLSQAMEEIGEAIAGSAHYLGSTLFVRGEHSEYMQESDMATIKMHFPAAQLQTVAKAGHWPHADNPEAFMHLLQAFLKRG